MLTFLGLIVVIVDPMTAGLGDSERAMGYGEPWDDNVNKRISAGVPAYITCRLRAAAFFSCEP